MMVFVSYSRSDAAFVDRLHEQLEQRGFDVWIDRKDIGASHEARWRRSVVKAIRDSDVVVLVLSPHSTVSNGVERELTVAAEQKKRLVPVWLKKSTLPDGFQYELAGLQYVDFGAVKFDEGIQQLAIQLDPTHDGPGGGGGGGRPRSWRDVLEEHKHALVAGACLLLVVIGAVVYALASDSSSSEEEQAEEVVAAWADATTRRDFAEAARLDPSRSAEELEQLYGAADDPIRMFAVNPYIASATGDGDRWRLTGAAIAWDYDPEPDVRTHVNCSEWEVDLAAGTATWMSGYDEFIDDEQVPPEQFPAAYDTTCV